MHLPTKINFCIFVGVKAIADKFSYFFRVVSMISYFVGVKAIADKFLYFFRVVSMISYGFYSFITSILFGYLREHSPIGRNQLIQVKHTKLN